jgi:GGDEF domain-containing protein
MCLSLRLLADVRRNLQLVQCGQTVARLSGDEMHHIFPHYRLESQAPMCLTLRLSAIVRCNLQLMESAKTVATLSGDEIHYVLSLS